ncbi:unnamed protein product [Adineta ricciae]|uniref:Uncharacterized protein n=1 Tax=Adineta ricciae TaxID=249248 RepID=A0A814Q7J1_ADIRI|nr:unnamed protein product [Adineta ricciae]CAF1115737.1 unnamed protein product [Adineta ricciae]
MTSTEHRNNLELLTLIWLDYLADATQENREVQARLRTKINYLRTFDNCQDCEHYIRNVIDDKQEKIVLIVSGRLGPDMTQRVHDLKQVVSIYVYCLNKEANEQWAKKYKKIRSVIVRLADLLYEIDRDQKSEEQKLNESIEISTNEDYSLPLLLRTKLSLKDRRDFVKFCSKEYDDNESQMEKVRDYEHLYSSSSALDYFFNETLLYRLLLKSLHTFNIKLLYFLRFFLQDIEKQLESLPTISGKVYRGQLMTTAQVDSLSQTVESEFIQFNTYFIASSNQEHIRQSLQTAADNYLQRVIFEIDDKNHVGKQYKQFSMFPITTTFRVTSVRLEQRIWIVQMTAHNDIHDSRLKEEIDPIQLAQYFREMNRLDQAEILFELIQTQHPSLTAECYDGLGRIAQDRGHYDISLSFYLKSLQTISSKNRTQCLNNIACAYDYLEQYGEAIQFYAEALDLMKTGLERSTCLNNMGVTYAKENEIQQALDCFQRALTLRRASLVENHPEIGICYANLGMIYVTRAQYDDALEHYNLALRSFSSNKFCDIPQAIVCQNMASIYYHKNQIDQALKYYQTAQKIFRQLRSADHPNLLYIQQQIEQIMQNK